MTTELPSELTVPAVSRYVRLARLVAAGVAAEAGLDVDDVEDLRMAVNELYALLVDEAESTDDRVVLRYSEHEGRVVVEGVRELAAAPGESVEIGLDHLALEILNVVADEHEFKADDRTRRFRVVKEARTGG